MHNKNGFTRTSLKDSTSSPKTIAEDRSESDRGKAVSHKIKTMCTVRLKRLKNYTVAISQTAHMNEKKLSSNLSFKISTQTLPESSSHSSTIVRHNMETILLTLKIIWKEIQTENF